MKDKDNKLWLTETETKCLFSDQRIALLQTEYEAHDHKKLGPYYSLKLGSYAVIVATDVSGDYICVRQFRHGIRQITTEFPAGGIRTGEGENISAEVALQNAKRELLEETGYVSDNWKHLFTVAANSTLADNYAYIFLAENCRKEAEQKLDETEYLEISIYTPGDLETLIRAGGFQHPVHILAWFLAKEY